MYLSYLLLYNKSLPKLNALKQQWSFYYPPHSLCGIEIEKALPGCFWLKVSHAVAVRTLEQGPQEAETPGNWSSIFLSSYSLRASPCGLSAWAVLGFEMSWQSRGTWTVYMTAESFKSGYFTEQEGSRITFYNPASEVIQHHFCAFCWLQASQKPAQI